MCFVETVNNNSYSQFILKHWNVGVGVLIGPYFGWFLGDPLCKSIIFFFISTCNVSSNLRTSLHNTLVNLCCQTDLFVINFKYLKNSNHVIILCNYCQSCPIKHITLWQRCDLVRMFSLTTMCLKSSIQRMEVMKILLTRVSSEYYIHSKAKHTIQYCNVQIFHWLEECCN